LDPIEAGIRYGGEGIAGPIAGMTGDVIAEGIQEVDDLSGGLLSDGARRILNSGIGKAGQKLLARGGQAWNSFKAKHPETAKTVEAAAEIGMLSMDAPVARTKGAVQILAPVDKVAKGGRTGESSILRRRTYETKDPREIAIAEQASNVPGWDNARSYTYNHQKLESDIRRRRHQLDLEIQRAGNPEIDKTQVVQELADITDNIKDMDYAVTLSGEAESYAKDMLKKAQQFIEASDGTTLGLLDARRKLDSWIADNSGTGFDPHIINGRNAAQRALRDHINTTVDARVPDVRVKEHLHQQHYLLDARDNLNDKLPAEGTNPLSRFLGSLSEGGHVGPVGATAIATGATAGAVTESLLSAAAGAGGVWAAYKAMAGPKRRQLLGAAMQYYQQQMQQNPEDESLKREYEVLQDMRTL
jgi:hypothetical protein